MFAGIGSQRIAAGSYMSTACSTATKSFQGTIAVASACERGTPGLAGIAWVARPEPASASSPSTWPW